MEETIKDANQQETRFIIKRSGKQVPYEPIKIRKAIEKANAEEAREDKKLTPEHINEIVERGYFSKYYMMISGHVIAKCLYATGLCPFALPHRRNYVPAGHLSF